MQYAVARGYCGLYAVDEFLYLRTSKCFSVDVVKT